MYFKVPRLYICYMAKKHQPIPPCPDPDLFILVKAKSGYYWRRKRGTVKPAKLNTVLAAFSEHSKVSMPAAKRLLQMLIPFTGDFDLRGSVQRFAPLFSKALITEGSMTWSYFADLEINYNYPLERRLKADYRVNVKDNSINVEIPLSSQMVIVERNGGVTGFVFELVVISGDPAKKNSLRSENDLSPEYPLLQHDIYSKKPATCKLSVQLRPNKPYIAMLKVACLEGQTPYGPKHQSMKVVAVG